MSVGNPATLRLQFFGAWTWCLGETVLPRLRSRQGQWLLALLVLKRAAPVERAWLAAALWPESSDSQSLYNLRRNLSDLRQALGDEVWRLRSPTPRTLSLDLSGADCDLISFDEAIARADPASLARAAALYQGPLLPGCLEEWAAPERAAREEAVLGTLEALATRAAQQGDAGGAAALLRRALEIDPLRESTARDLMSVLAASGNCAAASEAFRALRRRLREELNAEPDAQTVSLFRRLRAEARLAAARESGPSRAAAKPAGPTVEAQEGRLPAPLTRLIGRTREVAAVAHCLDRSRLLTLTGAGGVGKTRLALAVAEEVGQEYAAGAWFVDLAPLTDPELTVQTVLSALRVQEQPGQSPWQTLVDCLRPKNLLLVLDNCEHLVQACARLAQSLLEECPSLHVLATSRETLRVTGEVAWRVPSLSLPGVHDDDETDASEALQLFTERAAQVNPAFTLTGQNHREIVQICRRLDGIPLAIEMAAAWMRAMTAAQLVARLDDRFRLLTAPRGELLARRQTLRAAMDWSYDLLHEKERRLLARVSVFASGWTLEAAEVVCADSAALAGERPLDGHKPVPLEGTAREGETCQIEAWQVLALLSSLLDKSLVLFDEGENGGRYRLLETVRQYGQERLREGGARDAVSRAHRNYFLDFAEEARTHLAGPAEAQWLNRLEAEHDNLRAALAWSQENCPSLAGLRLAASLSRFWRVRGHLSEGRAFLSALRQASGAGPRQEAWREALRGEAHLALAQGRLAEAVSLFEQALDAARRAGDRRGEAAGLGDLGAARSNQGEFETARGLLEQALALNRELRNWEEQASNLGGLGYLAREAGDGPAAEAHLTEAVTLSREQGDTLSEGSNLGSLAYVLLQRGDREGARHLLGRTLVLYRALGNRLGEAWTLSSLGYVAETERNVAEAIALVQQALGINRAVGNRAGEAWNLNTLGGLQARAGHYGMARVTLHQALRLDREIGSRASEAGTLQRLGDAARGQGDDAAARSFYAASLALMQELNMRQGMADVLEAMARLPGDPHVSKASLNGSGGRAASQA